MALKVSVYIIISAFLLLFSIYGVQAKALSMLLLLIMVGPLFFLAKVANMFRRQVSVDFNEYSFLFKIKRNDEVYKEYNYELNDMVSFCPQIVVQKFVVIKFFLTNDATAEYSFIMDKTDEDYIKPDEVLNDFIKVIYAYNKIAEEKKISVRPSFFASSSGLFSIYSLIILFIVAVIVHVSKDVKTFPITLFISMAIIIQLLIRRSADLKFYKKYRDMLETG